jgi:IS30 family transposase
VCADRGSRLIRINKLIDKSSSANKDSIIRALRGFECNNDNGLENAQHEEINEALGCKSYFCEPYHSWEKGTIENRNGIIRIYLTDFSKISEEQIRQIETSINQTPMKCLNWLSAEEAHKGKREKDIMSLAKQMIHPEIFKSNLNILNQLVALAT